MYNMEVKGVVGQAMDHLTNSLATLCLQLKSEQPPTNSQPTSPNPIATQLAIRSLLTNSLPFITPTTVFDQKSLSILKTQYTFNLNEITSPGHKFFCVLHGSPALEGTVKITDSALVFDSSYNRRNLFFGSTRLIIERGEILEVERRDVPMALESVGVVTRKGELVFTPLYNAQQMLEFIQELIVQQQSPEPEQSQTQSVQSQPPDPTALSLIPGTLIRDLNRPLPTPGHILTYPNLTTKDFYRLLLSDTPAKYKNKPYQNYIVFNRTQQNLSQISCPKLSPTPPKYFQKSSTSNFGETLYSTRNISYKRKLPPIPIPFLPSHSCCLEAEKIYWLGPMNIVIEKEGSAKGVPFADSFLVKERTIVTQEGEDVKLAVSYEIEFKEGASFQTILRSVALSEIKKTAELNQRISKDYIKVVRARPKVVHKQQGNGAGEQVHEEEEVGNQPTEEAKIQAQDNKNKVIWIAVAIAVVLIILGIIVF